MLTLNHKSVNQFNMRTEERQSSAQMLCFTGSIWIDEVLRMAFAFFWSYTPTPVWLFLKLESLHVKKSITVLSPFTDWFLLEHDQVFFLSKNGIWAGAAGVTPNIWRRFDTRFYWSHALYRFLMERRGSQRSRWVALCWGGYVNMDRIKVIKHTVGIYTYTPYTVHEAGRYTKQNN